MSGRDRPCIAVFGAGNIGRSFVGQLFARSGWEVAFIDIDGSLVDALNSAGRYPVVVRESAKPEETIWVEGVRAVHGRDTAAVSAELASADLCATCVGKTALPLLLPALAAGLLARGRPLDLILAENDREAAATLRSGLVPLLPEGFPLGERLGLVETSIGKMVPLMRAENSAADRLRIYAESYNTLILDRLGFLGPLPRVAGLEPVDCIMAYVDRKLFIHNLGHAAIAYLGYRADPSAVSIPRALELPGVLRAARFAMSQTAEALNLSYPAAYSRLELEDHVEDLLLRFSNAALGDTVYRVGRDLPRKLGKTDRIVGSALLCERLSLPWNGIAEVFRAALEFRAVDEGGQAFPADSSLLSELRGNGIARLLERTCGLDRRDPVEARVFAGLEAKGPA